MTFTIKNSLPLSNPSNIGDITSKDTPKFLKFGPITITSHIFVPNRNYPDTKPTSPFFSHNLTSQSFTNQGLLIKLMLCPSGQIIKRGCLLWKNHRSSSTQNSFLSALMSEVCGSAGDIGPKPSKDWAHRRQYQAHRTRNSNASGVRNLLMVPSGALGEVSRRRSRGRGVQ